MEVQIPMDKYVADPSGPPKSRGTITSSNRNRYTRKNRASDTVKLMIHVPRRRIDCFKVSPKSFSLRAVVIATPINTMAIHRIIIVTLQDNSAYLKKQS